MKPTRLVSAVLLASAGAARACSACYTPANEEGDASRWAYYGTAIFLTLLPGLLLGVLATWIRRHGAPSRTPGGAEIGHLNSSI